MSRPSFTPPETWAPGASVPGTVYRVIRPLGQGGMGEVYEVEHDLLGTRRALKVLAKQFINRQDLTERLRVEARALARLSHPNLVEVYDLGTSADGRVFFAMELLNGATLRQLLRGRGPMSAQLAVRLMGPALDGLHSAHCAGLLHRDIKPENIFVCRSGIVKLLDFGVAKAIDASIGDMQLTGAGMTVGTPRYMAPEQAEGRQVDARADIYAAGLVLWELLVGHPAFDDTDYQSLAVAKMTDGVPPLASVLANPVPTRLCDAVDLACDKEAAIRFPTAQAFAAEIRAALIPELVVNSWTPPRSQRDKIEMDATIPQIDPIPSSTGHPSFGQGVATEIQLDPGPHGTAPNLDLVMADLTERIDAVEWDERDLPTRFASPEAPQSRGPGGTHILPSSAPQRRENRVSSRPASVSAAISAPQNSARVVLRASDRPTIQIRPPKASNGVSQARGLVHVFMAFSIPVVGATIMAFLFFRKAPEPTPLHQSPEPMLLKSASLPISPAPSAAPVVSPSSTAQTPLPTVSSKPAPKAPKLAPAKTPKPSMPSSGL